MVELTKQAPEWNNAGTQPPQSLMDAGWQANQKPPADYFNWFFYTGYQAIKELQEKAALQNNVTTAKDGLMSKEDKAKLDGMEKEAQKNPGVATTEQAGLMSSADREKLDSVQAGANKYTHPSTHSLDIITETDTKKIMTSAERKKLSEIAEGAQVNRTIATTEQAEAGTDNTTAMTPLRTKQAINKLPNATTTANGLMSSGDKKKLDTMVNSQYQAVFFSEYEEW